jgi:hypothetical protein
VYRELPGLQLQQISATGDTMKKIASHHILVGGNSFITSKKHVTHFFQRTDLVRYDYISINRAECLEATSPHFFDILDDKIKGNKDTLTKLIQDLEAAGVNTINDLLSLQQGYPSKVLHIATHFIDGFIGIDSVFYNLVDDSHWLPESTRNIIHSHPQEYWLIHLNGYSHTPEKAALVQH